MDWQTVVKEWRKLELEDNFIEGMTVKWTITSGWMWAGWKRTDTADDKWTDNKSWLLNVMKKEEIEDNKVVNSSYKEVIKGNSGKEAQ